MGFSWFVWTEFASAAIIGSHCSARTSIPIKFSIVSALRLWMHTIPLESSSTQTWNFVQWLKFSRVNNESLHSNNPTYPILWKTTTSVFCSSWRSECHYIQAFISPSPVVLITWRTHALALECSSSLLLISGKFKCCRKMIAIFLVLPFIVGTIICLAFYVKAGLCTSAFC